MNIFVKSIPGLVLPAQAQAKTEDGNVVQTNAAGYDVIATSDPKIVGHTVDNLYARIDYIEYETNLYIAPEAQSFHTLIHPRSSISKYNLMLANSIGLIDNDYRGQILFRFNYIWQPEDFKISNGVIYGTPNKEKIYKNGDAIGQILAEPTVTIDWIPVGDLAKTDRGTGGFGSSVKESTVEGTLQAMKAIVDHLPGETLEDLYKKSGGIPTRTPYTELIRQREQKTKK